MTKERIRILVDTSRDNCWSNGLIYIEPDNRYQTTNNRDYLSEAVLKNYDVLTICSNTSLKYTDAELQLIRDFVENGGGLLLAANTSRFERDVCEPISELGVNHVASLFGARFLLLPEGHEEMDIEASLLRLPPEGHGEMDIEANPLRSYTKKNLRLTNHEIVDGWGINDLGLMHCGPLDVPADSSVFLEHSETENPVGACLHSGSGRVLLINSQIFQGGASQNHLVFGQFMDWLGSNRVSLTTGTQTIPDEIPIEEQVREDRKIKIFYTQFTEDRVDTCMTYAKKLQKEMLSKFPEGEKIEWQINLLPSDLIPSATLGYSFGSGRFVGVCVSPARLAYAFGFEASGLLARCSENGTSAWISEFCLKPQPSEKESFLEEVGAALLSELHSKLVKREYEQVSWTSQGEAEKNYVRRLFHNLGYTSTYTNSVWMFRIINLPMLLGELTPLLSKRLSESEAYKNWQGTIGIKGDPEHQASLIISDGEIRVSAEVSEGPAIHLSTDDKTLTRFILGVLTPYEAFLQNQLHVAPSVNPSVTGLLETLFPARQQVEDRGPQWLPSRLYHV